MAFPFDLKIWPGSTGWEFPKRSARGHHSNPREVNLFKGDEGDYLDALNREGLQNILDAAIGDGPAHARFRIVRVPIEHLRAIFGEAVEHWEASGIALSSIMDGEAAVLAIEDYNTSGLTGPVSSTEATDGGYPAMVFWSGNSNKTGKGGSGRFGLGKFALLASSAIRSFFLYTIRACDESRTPYFIGKGMLEAHEVNGVKCEPWGFFYDRLAQDGDGCELPFEGEKAKALAQMLGARRGSEPGTSVLIPFPHAGITEESLARATMTHFFHQILRGKLVVDIGDVRIDADTIGGLVARNFPPEHAIHSRMRVSRLFDDPSVKRFRVVGATKSSLELRTGDVEDLKGLKEAWSLGEPFVIEARFAIEFQGEGDCHDDGGPDLLFGILPSADDVPAEVRKPLFIRKGCTIPAQYWGMQRGVVVGEVVSHRAIWFFNQCENPAHDRWYRGDAPSPTVFSQVVTAARRLEDICAPPKEDASVNSRFTEFFSVRMPERRQEIQPPGRRVPVEGGSDERLPGVRGQDETAEDPVLVGEPGPRDPASRLSFAYDGGTFVARGRVAEADHGTILAFCFGYKINKRKSGIKKHSPLDFDLADDAAHGLVLDGAEVSARDGNSVSLRLTGGPLSVRIGGFDHNRALDYSVTSEQAKEAVTDAE